ncbi:MAG: MFS transporter [Intrasporangium sp.]|uniref:MFS transporter n=1 Tax=Intrasporangium sp. TaxID=1925024 RepID=UPI0026493462|nr:MFS transporter [Intrasporangium sp.]MDN5795366.1 MFS transporter [Intrasporangium sp.]
MATSALISAVRRVQAGWAVATTAAHLAPIVLFVLAFDRGGPTLLVACSVLISVLGILANSRVGMLADRLPLTRVLRWVVALGSAAMVLSAVSALARWPAVVSVATGSLAVALLSTYRPLQAALLPWIVHTPRELARANIGAAGTESIASLVGPALAGVVLLVTSPADAVVACALCAVFAPLPLLGLSVAQAAPARRDPVSRRESYAAGLVALWRAVPGGGASVLSAAQTFARGALQVLLVLLVLETFRLGNDTVGWLWAAMGVGGLVGALVGSRALRVTRLARGFVLGVMLWGVGLVVVAVTSSSPWTAGLGMLVVGFGNAVEDASMFTFIARRAPHGAVARALSAIEIIAFTSMALGSLAAPGLAQAVGQRGATLAIGVIVVVLALAYALTFHRIDGAATESAGHADFLADVEVFEVLPVVLVEHLAGRLERNDYATGTVVIREGAEGDSFHIVASGSATVDVHGSPRPPLGPGDGFGEIALLRQSARTATVTAAEPLTTYSLERDDFLTAIQGRSASAEALADLRLSRDTKP